jgi:hypothetical protein
MVNRIVRLLVLLFGALGMAACSPGGLFSGDLMWTPHRQIASQPDQAGEATRALLGGLLTHQVTLTEAQATGLLRQAWGVTPTSAIRDVRLLFDPDRVYLKILLRQGVIPGIPGDTALNLAGRLATVDGKLQVAVDQVGLGVIPIAPADALALLNQALTTLLQDQAGRAAGAIALEQGVLIISLE